MIPYLVLFFVQTVVKPEAIPEVVHLVSPAGEERVIQQGTKPKNLLIILDRENIPALKKLWYLMDFESPGFKITPVLTGRIGAPGMRDANESQLPFFLDRDQVFAEASSYPRYYLFSKNQTAGDEGLPEPDQLVDWSLKSYLARPDKEELVLKLGDDRVSFQEHENDCGAAVMVSMLERLRKVVPKSFIYEALDHGPEGKAATFLELKEVVESLGMEGDGWRGAYEDLLALDKPAVLHVDQTHFVLLVKATRSGALVVDPALGRLFITVENLKKRWEGVYFYVSSH